MINPLVALHVGEVVVGGVLLAFLLLAVLLPEELGGQLLGWGL